MRLIRWPGARRVALSVMLLSSGLVGGSRYGPGQAFSMETYDDLLVRVEQKAPGFGGMFTGEDGRLVVYLLDPSKIKAAQSAIQSVFGPGRIPTAGVRALRGRYTISQLKRWSERSTGLLEIAGVTVVDLDETRNRVAIGLDDASKTAAVNQRLKSLGIPLDAVALEVVGSIRQLDDAQTKDRPADRDRSRPPQR